MARKSHGMEWLAKLAIEKETELLDSEIGILLRVLFLINSLLFLYIFVFCHILLFYYIFALSIFLNQFFSPVLNHLCIVYIYLFEHQLMCLCFYIRSVLIRKWSRLCSKLSGHHIIRYLLSPIALIKRNWFLTYLSITFTNVACEVGIFTMFGRDSLEEQFMFPKKNCQQEKQMISYFH